MGLLLCYQSHWLSDYIIYGCFTYIVLFCWQSHMFWHLKGTLYHSMWTQLLVSCIDLVYVLVTWLCVHSTVMSAYHQVLSNTAGVRCVMNRRLMLTPLFLMWHVSQPLYLHHYPLSLSVPTVSEVIYKYRKQQEAEHLHEREVILLCTHRPIMMGVWMGHTLLSGTWPMRKRISIGNNHDSIVTFEGRARVVFTKSEILSKAMWNCMIHNSF